MTSIPIEPKEAYCNNNKSRLNKFNNNPKGEYRLKNILTSESRFF